MAIPRFTVDERLIIEFINSPELSQFHQQMKEKLGVSNYRYPVNCEDIKYENGYPKEEIKASLRFSEHYTKINDLCFFVKSIKQEIDNRFFRVIDRDAFKEAVIICIKYALIHELMHVKQFDDGLITENYMREQNKKDYKDREVEQLADEEATKFINDWNDYEKRVINILKGNESITNEMMCEFVDFYHQIYNHR